MIIFLTPCFPMSCHVLAGPDVAGVLQLVLQPHHLLHLQLGIPGGLPQDPHTETAPLLLQGRQWWPLLSPTPGGTGTGTAPQRRHSRLTAVISDAEKSRDEWSGVGHR